MSDLEKKIEGNLVGTEDSEKSTLSSGEKLLAALGYISFFCILPLVLKPDSEFCQFHGKQGLVLTLIFLLFSWIGLLGIFFVILLKISYILIAGFGIVNAIQGQEWKIPVVEKMAKKFDW